MTRKKRSVPDSASRKKNSTGTVRSRRSILRSIWGLGICLNKQNDGLRESGGHSFFKPLYAQRHCLPSKYDLTSHLTSQTSIEKLNSSPAQSRAEYGSAPNWAADSAFKTAFKLSWNSFLNASPGSFPSNCRFSS